MDYSKALAMCGATLIAAAAVGLAVSPVHGRPISSLVVVAPPSEVVVRHVAYADLDLATKPGARILNRRIGHAVKEICVEAVGTANPMDFDGCSKDAWRSASPQVASALRRAREIALTGSSSIAAVAITIDISQ